MKNYFCKITAGFCALVLVGLAVNCRAPDETDKASKAESITISGGNFSLNTGEEKKIAVVIQPAEAADEELAWRIMPSSRAFVDDNNTIHALEKGEALVTVYIKAKPAVYDEITVSIGDPSLPTPVVADFTISGSFSQTANSVTAITVTPKDANKSQGAITVLYNNSATVPQTAGTYTVTFNVAAVSGKWNAVTLTAGTLTVSAPPNTSLPTPVAGDFNINGNLSQTAGGVTAFTVTPKDSSKSQGAITVLYNNSATVPQTAGTYTVTFNVAAVSGKWNAANGLPAGTLTVTNPGTADPAEIFNTLKGQKITTNGWADYANSGAGLSYANPSSYTLIDDAKYPNAKNKRTAFTNAINSDSAKFVIVSGDIDLGDGVITDTNKTYFDQFDPGTHKRLHGDIVFNIGSNTTIIGINNARLMFGGLKVSGKNNVIIQNVVFYDAHGSTEYDTGSSGNSESKASIDGLVVQSGSNGVWVDHCKFTDGTCNDMIRNFNHDGAFDIPAGKNITVSWCEFTNHDKVMLVAGSDSAANAVVADRQITLHHNYFHKTTQRMPRTRGTQMHIYNNYYVDIGVSGNSGACMGPGWNAHFIVENNNFGARYSGNLIVDYKDSAAYPAIVWSAGNNVTISRSPNDKTSGGKPWEPASYYTYTLEPNSGLPGSVTAGAGPTLYK